MHPNVKERNIQLERQTIHNYDASLIVPIGELSDEVIAGIQDCISGLEQNGLEVILVTNSGQQKNDLLELLKQHPFVNWKLIGCEKDSSTTPAGMIMYALPEAGRRYVVLIERITQVSLEIVAGLRRTIRYYAGHFAIAQESGGASSREYSKPDDGPHRLPSVIALVAGRIDLENIGCLDTGIDDWNLAMLNLQARLALAGIKRLRFPEAMPVSAGGSQANECELPASFLSWQRKKLYPSSIQLHKEPCSAQGEVLYSYQQNVYSEEQFDRYVQPFLSCDKAGQDIFQRNYKVLLLAQCYNEEEMMPGFLKNMEPYVDGIILLDDESTDRSYDVAQHEKIIVKVKKTRTKFNDLENRNILLDLASFFKADWLCFMDIDERFDNRYADFAAFMGNPQVSVVLFNFIHIWKGSSYYHASYPKTKEGFFERFRMFRNIGRMQIRSSNALHFSAVPYFDNQYRSNILILHLGNCTEERRNKKYAFYKKEDNEYDHKMYDPLLLEQDILLRHVDNIRYTYNRFYDVKK